jgi:hypothetical protein
VFGVPAKLELYAGKYGLLAAFHTHLIFYSADFRDTASGFVVLSRDGRIDHFSPNNVACNEI